MKNLANSSLKKFSVSLIQRNNIVYIKASLGGKSITFSTAINCRTSMLDKKAFIVKNDENATNILQAIRTDLQRTYSDFVITRRELDIREIKQTALSQIKDSNIPTLIECLEKFLKDEFETLEGIQFEKKTVDKKRYLVERIKDYIIHTYNNRHLSLAKLRPIDAQNLVNFCKTKFNHGHNHAVLHAEFLKRTLNYAIANEWIDKNPFQFFKPKRERKKVETLTESEIIKLQNIKFNATEYIYVNDVFLFCCYTGLSYVDVARLNETHLFNLDSNKPLIKIKRGKNENLCIIPLVFNALAILEKYKDNQTAVTKNSLLPVYSNQAMNRILKEIQALAGIELRLTTHVARKTCATFYINNGVPLTSVSTMLGHKKTSTTELYYTQRTETTVIKHFEEFQNKSRLKNLEYEQ